MGAWNLVARDHLFAVFVWFCFVLFCFVCSGYAPGSSFVGGFFVGSFCFRFCGHLGPRKILFLLSGRVLGIILGCSESVFGLSWLFRTAQIVK